jgi:hypothetical protein
MPPVTSFLPWIYLVFVHPLHFTSAHIWICFKWGKGLGFTTRKWIPFYFGNPIGISMIPNASFPFFWNFNPGSCLPLVFFLMLGEFMSLGEPMSLGGSYMGGSMMPCPTNTPFAPNTSHVQEIIL